MAPTVREAVPADLPDILEFIRGLARYERAEDKVVATVDDLEAALFGDNAKARCFIAGIDGKSVGCAVFFYNFSTWTGRYGIYLEDLFVEVAHRGTGAGLALMQAQLQDINALVKIKNPSLLLQLQRAPPRFP